MISTEVQDNKMLVVAHGSINVVIEPQPARKGWLMGLRKQAPAIAVSGLSGAVASVLITLFVTSLGRGAMEDRLAARIAEINDHLTAVASSVGTRSEAQSDRLISHVDQIGTQIEHVGRQVQDVGDTVDGLPTTLQRASESSTKTLISWLSSLRSPAVKSKPPLLTVHGPEKRHSTLP